MSLLSRLSRLFADDPFGASVRPSEAPETAERLATAALLVHVARVDGRFSEPERQRLRLILIERYGLAPDAAERLLERAGELDYESGDWPALVDLFENDADDAERKRIVGLAYEVARADGAIHEFEDGLVWRLGRALGLDEGAIAEARGAASGP